MMIPINSDLIMIPNQLTTPESTKLAIQSNTLLTSANLLAKFASTTEHTTSHFGLSNDDRQFSSYSSDTSTYLSSPSLPTNTSPMSSSTSFSATTVSGWLSETNLANYSSPLKSYLLSTASFLTDSSSSAFLYTSSNYSMSTASPLSSSMSAPLSSISPFYPYSVSSSYFSTNTSPLTGSADLNSQSIANSVVEDDDKDDIVRKYSRITGALDTMTMLTLGTAYAVLIFIGTIGNGLVCLAVARQPKMRTSRNLFIINLAISDLLLCFFTIPFSLLEISTKFWPFGLTMCKLVVTMEATSIFVSTLSITAIALDRYQVILHSMNPDQSRGMHVPHVVKLLIIWMIGMLLALPLFIFRTIDEHLIGIKEIDPINYCVEKWPIEHGRGYYSVLSMLIQYVLPITIVTVVYTRLCMKLRTRTLRRQSTTQLSKLRTRLQRRARKTNLLLISIAIIFCVSWLPLNVLNVVADLCFPFKSDRSFRITFAICHMAGMSSSCSNPFLYGWLNQNFRNEFEEIFNSMKGCLFCRTGNLKTNEHQHQQGHSRHDSLTIHPNMNTADVAEAVLQHQTKQRQSKQQNQQQSESNLDYDECRTMTSNCSPSRRNQSPNCTNHSHHHNHRYNSPQQQNNRNQSSVRIKINKLTSSYNRHHFNSNNSNSNKNSNKNNNNSNKNININNVNVKINCNSGHNHLKETNTKCHDPMKNSKCFVEYQQQHYKQQQKQSDKLSVDNFVNEAITDITELTNDVSQSNSQSYQANSPVATTTTTISITSELAATNGPAIQSVSISNCSDSVNNNNNKCDAIVAASAAASNNSHQSMNQINGGHYGTNCNSSRCRPIGNGKFKRLSLTDSRKRRRKKSTECCSQTNLIGSSSVVSNEPTSVSEMTTNNNNNNNNNGFIVTLIDNNNDDNENSNNYLILDDDDSNNSKLLHCYINNNNNNEHDNRISISEESF